MKSITLLGMLIIYVALVGFAISAQAESLPAPICIERKDLEKEIGKTLKDFTVNDMPADQVQPIIKTYNEVPPVSDISGDAIAAVHDNTPTVQGSPQEFYLVVFRGGCGRYTLRLSRTELVIIVQRALSKEP